MKPSVKLVAAVVGSLVLAVLVVLVVRSGEDGPDVPFERGEQAAPADELVDSVGVNVHLSYRDTAYGDHRRVKAALVDLGVRHIRDYPVPQNVEAINDLAEEGIGLTAVMGTPQPRPWMPHDLEELYAVVRDDVLDAVVAIEGANEWDNTSEEAWADQLRTHQEALWELVHGDERTEQIPVLAPSITWEGNMDEAGDLSDWSDFGNIHPYPGGAVPEDRVADDLATTQEENVDGADVWVTETGYHNAVGFGRGHPGVTEEVAAVYLPQLFLHHFSIGVPRTFSYELVDQLDDPEDREASFGLVREDFTPKPAYVALRQLLGLFDDPGPAFRPGRLDYAVAGADDDARHLLFQKRDGTFLLALWHAGEVWDADDEEPVAAASTPVTVELTQPLAEGRLWTLGDAEPEVLDAPTSVALELSPTVQVLELVPGQVSSPG